MSNPDTDPKPKFKLGDRVEIVDDGKVIDEGEVSFNSGYDEWLGQYRYKVQTKTSRVTYNENSLRKKKKKRRKKNPSSTNTTELVRKLSF